MKLSLKHTIILIFTITFIVIISILSFIKIEKSKKQKAEQDKINAEIKLKNDIYESVKEIQYGIDKAIEIHENAILNVLTVHLKPDFTTVDSVYGYGMALDNSLANGFRIDRTPMRVFWINHGIKPTEIHEIKGMDKQVIYNGINVPCIFSKKDDKDLNIKGDVTVFVYAKCKSKNELVEDLKLLKEIKTRTKWAEIDTERELNEVIFKVDKPQRIF